LKRSPFTSVPERLAGLARPRRADLHLHTTASDGEYTPAQVVALARQANLVAVAITDHDTFAGVEESRGVAGESVEVVPGVEISACHNGREVHLLGYFIRTDNSDLNAALATLRSGRCERFHGFVARLAEHGVALPEDRVRLVAESSPSLGRRHLAGLLQSCGIAKTRYEAFQRYLGPAARTLPPKLLIPVEEAIQLVTAAGGIASLAHPSPELADADFRRLAEFGLAALEVEYPWAKRSIAKRLREAALRLGLAMTGGSDCHGPDPSHRRIGSYGITAEELTALRGWVDRRVSYTS
jgi:3',5'-nucleoside bisphosphate phosphatase